MLHFRRAVARPWQTKIITRGVVAGFLVFAAFGFERFNVKQVHVAHVRLQALRTLAGVANRPAGLVDLTQDVFRHGLVHAFDFLHFVILNQLFGKAQFFSKLVHDHVVATAFPQGLNDFFTPLNRAVRCGDRATGLKLRGCWQQVHRTVRVQVFGLTRHGGHGGGGRWIRVNHHQQVQLVHRTLHF